MRRWLISLAIPLAGVAVLLLAVIVLGRWALDRLKNNDRYSAAFADISCAAPPGQTRENFLEEVQYLASWPDRLRLLDAKLPRQLAEAFIQHPWVERVDKVEVGAQGIHVHLTYRTPVLAVSRPGADGPLRAVDGVGILLPLAAVSADLPLLDAVVPTGAAAGLALDDARVRAAASTAAVLRPHQGKLRISRIAIRSEEVHLVAAAGGVHWGHAPGDERSGEPTAEEKLSRLLAWNEKAEGDCDLRK